MIRLLDAHLSHFRRTRLLFASIVMVAPTIKTANTDRGRYCVYSDGLHDLEVLIKASVRYWPHWKELAGMEELPKLITINEAAKQLNAHPDKLRRWVNQGLIAGVCLLPANRRHKLQIRQESIDVIFAEAARQEARQRAYEKEAQERYNCQLDAFDW